MTLNFSNIFTHLEKYTEEHTTCHFSKEENKIVKWENKNSKMGVMLLV